MEFVKINFSPARIKYIVFNNIKTSVFDNNGIIFGGFVRDMIISDHYKSIYNSCNEYNIHKFWNKLFNPETAGRALVANDMDICMYSEEDVSNFIYTIQNIFSEQFGYINVLSSDTIMTTEMTTDNSYFDLPIKYHRKLNYTVTVGKIPFVNSGVELSFDFDIIIPKKSFILPPFNKTDMLCNVFILNKNGIIISNNTGTNIDKMTILNKQKIAASIMGDIVQYKTQFCMQDYSDEINYPCGTYDYNKIVIASLDKMLSRSLKWDITNLPFLICDQKIDNCVDNCCICLSAFKKNDKILKVISDNSTKTEKVCSNITHDKCLFKYFKTQLNNGLVSSDNFQFRCPSRNVINFKICAENICDIIREKIK
jgi:hypothetical protein